MLPLKHDSSIKTFDQVLISYKPGTQRGFKRMFLNFDKFCKAEYEATMEEMVRELLKAKDPTVYRTIQDWINFNQDKSGNTIKVWYSYLKKYLTHRGINLTKSKDNLNFKRVVEEERYPLSQDEIKKILDVAGNSMRMKILVQLSSGMRRGEMLQLKKKDFIVGKRIMIKIPPSIAKFNKARTTFVSSEASQYLIPRLKQLKDNDIVLGTKDLKPENIGDSYEQNLTRYLEQTGLDMRYESTGYHKINTHSFRAWFITKISRHDENIAKKLAGQKVYMGQYDRLSDEEKLEKYIEFESDLFIFKAKPKSEEILELTRHTEELEKKQELTEDALNTLLQIASGKEWGHSDEEVTAQWDDFSIKFNKFLKLPKKERIKKTLLRRLTKKEKGIYEK